MGASTSWLAIKGKPRADALQDLGLKIGDSPQEANETGLQGSDFPEGWYVVAAAGYEHPLTDDAVLKKLSVGCDVVSGGAETHVMSSVASGWRDGRRVWYVRYDSDNRPDGLVAEGDLPPSFAGIRADLEAAQEAEGEDAGVDYIFDAPAELSHALTGYHYDEPSPGEDWHSLVPQVPGPQWLGRLFNR